ncbi:SusC/RagA family TonB-linked outer membrane protein [Maribellus mangrovi]|uniref:SusC/RagA family TonB-linked outer membrane protein n=1 Tax=Maribellus mangrovi TaxID=3133146 RepID=UPI0030EB541E
MGKIHVRLIYLLILVIGISSVAFAQQKTVTGRVTDSSNKPLPGVSIVVKGTAVGTVTNTEGTFNLSISENAATLVFSYIGMKTQEIKIGAQTTFNIVMEEDIAGLEEVVVVGYGTQKKVNLTGAVAKIDSEEMQNRAVNSTSQVLQGLAPGLNASVNNGGGASDATMSLNIRGIGSLSSSNPYVLVDGVRANINGVNPEDIESVSVLKDAAAAAIYGAEAAYGVILITTKKGQKNSSFKLNYSNSFNMKQLIYLPETVSSVEFAQIANDAGINFRGSPIFSEEAIQEMQDHIDGNYPYGTGPMPNNGSRWLGIGGGGSGDWYSGRANTDWFDVMYKDYAVTQQHNLSVSGGSEKLTYYVSTGFLTDPGMLNFGEESFSKNTFSSNINAEVTNWLNLGVVSRMTRRRNSFPTSAAGANRQRLYHDIMRYIPTAPAKTPAIYDDEGNEIVPEQDAQVAFFTENYGFEEYTNDEFINTFKAEIKLLPGWNVKGDYTFKRVIHEQTLNYKKATFYGPDGSATVYNGATNRIQKDYRHTDYHSFNIYTNYSKTFDEKHNLKVLLGVQQQESYFTRLIAQRYNVINDDLNSLNVAVGESTDPNNPESDWATLGAFGRLSYDYMEKYLFEFNGRYDGASKFPEDHRFGFFPSFALGYNMHKENYWEPLSNIFNTFKLRASYGTLGNQNVDSYLHLPNLPIKTELAWIMGSSRPNYSNMPGIVSPNITWETSKTKNFGFNFTSLNNRLSAEFDVFERITENMFGPVSALPAVLGTNPPKTNSATLKTTGFELTLGWRDQIKDFKYNVEFMLSDSKSVITEYHNPEKLISSHYVGEVLGEIWGYEAESLFQTQEEVDEYLAEVDMSYLGSRWSPGNVKYLDLNGDGKINIGDNTLEPEIDPETGEVVPGTGPGDRRVIGNSRPRYLYTVKAGASWKSFDFNMLWQGVGKRDVWLNDYTSLFWGWNRKAHSHITEEVMDYWSEDNPDAYLPKPLDASGKTGFTKDRQVSTRYLQDGSYVRLKNIQLGYTVPMNTGDKSVIKRLRLFVSGENLLTITNFWSTLDPEVGAISGSYSSGRTYPLSKVYSAGLNVTF